MNDRFHVSRADGIVRLTIDNPTKGNAFDAPMLGAFPRLLEEIARAGDCRVLVLQGTGDDFSIGRDPDSARGQAHLPAYAYRSEIAKIVEANDALGRFPMPTIASVRGRALGFGAGLAARCDLAVAAATARFGFPEIRGGLPPTIVISYLGKAIARRRAFELVVTGREIPAVEAERLELVNQVVALDALDETVDALARDIAAKDDVALATVKRFFNDVRDLSWEQAAQQAIDTLVVAMRR